MTQTHQDVNPSSSINFIPNEKCSLVYGILLGLSKNTGKPFKASFKEIQAIADLSDIELLSILEKFQTKRQVLIINFGDEMAIHMAPYCKGVVYA